MPRPSSARPAASASAANDANDAPPLFPGRAPPAPADRPPPAGKRGQGAVWAAFAVLLAAAGMLYARIRAERAQAAGWSEGWDAAEASDEADGDRWRGKVVALDEAGFDAAVAEGLTLVMFEADWCAPCKMQAPVLADLARALDGRAKVATVDIGRHRGLHARERVVPTPTLIIYRDGREVERMEGTRHAGTLLAALRKHR